MALIRMVHLAGSLAFLFAAPAWAEPPSQCRRLIVTAHPSYKPLHWYDGKEMRGASIDLARRVFDEMRVAYEIRYVGPWPRVLKLAEIGKVDVVMSLKDTLDRREYMAFTSTPSFGNPMAVFVRQDRVFSFTRWEDLVGKHGGVNSGDHYGEGFDEFLQDRLQVEATTEMAANFRKLAIGRIDYYVTGLYPGLSYLADNPGKVPMQALPRPINLGVVHVGFARKSPCLHLLPEFDRRLRQLAERHETDALLEKHLGALRRAAMSPASAP